MLDVDALADQAEVIIGGFAAIPYQGGYKIANLNNAYGVAVFTPDGMLVETNMDDVELSIARKVLAETISYAEV
ncbi:MAG: hypothetical protein Q4B54_03580 [Coriobacteriales bacterium]|nr:hypothetical protein [Coriobacteriales bacterium]